MENDENGFFSDSERFIFLLTGAEKPLESSAESIPLFI